MQANFISLESIEGLDRLFALSCDKPILLFKHSSTCGISAGVYREVGTVADDVHIVTVQTHRHLSNIIAERTGIRHESPQAIVIRCGKPVYAAAHYDIESAHIEDTIESSRNTDC